jgi:hypothetical protein
VGGFEIYDPNQPLINPVDPNWYFNNTSNTSYNFFLTPPDAIEPYVAIVGPDEWTVVEETGAIYSVEANVISLAAPWDEIPPEALWGIALAGDNYSVCESGGFGENNLPSLPFPHLAAE